VAGSLRVVVDAAPVVSQHTPATSENQGSRKYTCGVTPGHARQGRPLETQAAGATTRPGAAGARRRGRQPVALPVRLAAAHTAYTAQLSVAPLSAETRRTYASKTRQYLAWLPTAVVDGDPLTNPAARDQAVGDWRAHLVTAANQAPATVNNALAAVDDFYARRGMGRAAVERTSVPAMAPRSLTRSAQLRWLRAVESDPSPRDRALASLPFYAGARIAETVRLDTSDVATSGHQGVLHIHGNGDRIREVPIHPNLRADIHHWLADRGRWPGADTNPALFLNHRGGRLSVRGARDVIARIAVAAGLGADTTAQVLRHTFAATLVAGGTDLVLVADLLGHARLDTTRSYAAPTAQDRIKALGLLPSTTDRAIAETSRP
jgi:site-specific recombinase XerD